MKRGSTLFLRAAVFGMGLFVVFLCMLVLPAIHRGWVLELPEIPYMRYPVLLGIMATTIPFFIALFQTLKLLSFVDRNVAFSERSVRALGVIKYCALAIGVVYVMVMPLVYHIANQEDAPGLVIFGLSFTFAPIVIAVFAAVCQRLLRAAIALKSENDLTV